MSSDFEPAASEFETWVQDALDRLPDWVQEQLDQHGIVVVVQDIPYGQVREEFGSDVFGLFTGRALADQNEPGMIQEPTRIELYEQVFRKHFSDPEELKDQVRRTVVHEVGHFLGMDEAELRERGY